MEGNNLLKKTLRKQLLPTEETTNTGPDKTFDSGQNCRQTKMPTGRIVFSDGVS